MVNYNLTPFTATIDDPARLKHMAMVKAPLQTVYDGKIENLRLHIQDFTCRIKNTGLYHEFLICTTENPQPADIPDDTWTFDHPLRWQTANYIENFNSVTFSALLQEKERVEDTLEMLNDIPMTSTEEGAPKLASKQHRMWIAEMLRNSWTSTVASEMNAFEEDPGRWYFVILHLSLREHRFYE
jgi:hypothetical protein